MTPVLGITKLKDTALVLLQVIILEIGSKLHDWRRLRLNQQPGSYYSLTQLTIQIIEVIYHCLSKGQLLL